MSVDSRLDIFVYDNFYNDRRKLYKKYNGDKKGRIYVIVNKLNGKLYVGSTKSLANRLKNYLNLAHIAAQKNRPIHNAILKYGLVNFAFIIVEEVDTNLHNVEDRETFWILRLNPEYNATKNGAKNVGTVCTDEMKLIISKKRSSGSIYIYNEFKQLLVIAPSLRSIATLLGNASITIALKRAIETNSLFRGSWYLSRAPLLNEQLDALIGKPLMAVPSEEYTNLIAQMKSQKHILRAVFVFKDKEFICKYNGIMEAERALKISHDTIKLNIENNTTYKGYTFSYHRIMG